MLTVGSLFSGIGGLDLGLERAGMSVVWQCEADPYCRAVLRKHWPDVPCYDDVRAIGAELERVDVLAGGFPCQPVSLAGRRRGAADERWLWPEFARLIRVLRPRYALMENVPGLLAGGGMASVLGDLAECGYDAEWDRIPAAAVGAPHLRYRVLIVAYPNGERPIECRLSEGEGRPSLPDVAGSGGFSSGAAGTDRQWSGVTDVADATGERWSRRGSAWLWRDGPSHGRGWAPEPQVGRVADGFPGRVDQLRALGNAVVPQVAEYVGRLIVAHAEREEEVA